MQWVVWSYVFHWFQLDVLDLTEIRFVTIFKSTKWNLEISIDRLYISHRTHNGEYIRICTNISTAIVRTFRYFYCGQKGSRRENDVQFRWRKRDGSRGTLIGVHLEKVYQRSECLRARSKDVRDVGGWEGCTLRELITPREKFLGTCRPTANPEVTRTRPLAFP